VSPAGVMFLSSAIFVEMLLALFVPGKIRHFMCITMLLHFCALLFVSMKASDRMQRALSRILSRVLPHMIPNDLKVVLPFGETIKSFFSMKPPNEFFFL
jgi:hypothetical protein